MYINSAIYKLINLNLIYLNSQLFFLNNQG